MIKWTKCLPRRILPKKKKKYQRVEDKLGKRNIDGQKRKKVADRGEPRKRSKKKIIAASIIIAGFLALIAFAVMVFVFDIGPVREIKSSEGEAKVVGSVAGFEVKYEELRYITLLYRAELDSEIGKYETLSDERKAEYEKVLEEKVLEEIKSNYVVLSLCKKYGVDTDTRECRSAVNDSIESLVDELGGKKEYKAWLAENCLTDALVRLMYKVDYLESALLEKLSVDKTEIKYTTANLDDFVKFVMEDESYAKVIHVFYPREHDLYAQRGSDMRSEAEATYKKLCSAEGDEERYEYMRTAIGKAPAVSGYSTFGFGNYITYGQMPEAYETAAFSLGDYGISEIIEQQEGCYIIMRMPKDRDEVAPHAYEYIEYYRYAVLKRIEDTQKEAIKFEGNEYFDNIRLVEIE